MNSDYSDIPKGYEGKVKGVPIVEKWRDVEPQNGVFIFDKIITPQLEQLANAGLHTFLMIWVAPKAPEWLFDEGVPLVEMKPHVNPLGEERNSTYQYYLDGKYQFFYYRFIDAFGKYLKSLPDHLREVILFVQSAEGSTGDGGCYKGDPIDPKYDISGNDWEEYRIVAWSKFKEAFATDNGEWIVPLAVNFDNRSEKTSRWIEENMDDIYLKKGDFSHGYHISGMSKRLDDFNAIVTRAKSRGKKVYSRGEQDAEWKTHGWSANNPEQAFYWSGLFATHNGLDMWNIPFEAMQKHNLIPTIDFFNKYSRQHDSGSSTAAFCALRKGLDASDTDGYPVKLYGKARRSNTDRYIKIAQAHNRYGAVQQDPGRATKGMMINRKRKGYNDVGWDIVPSNYCRFLTQIDADQTSVGYWHIDKTIYGRFARGFEKASGRDAMYFALDPDFFAGGVADRVKLTITYLDNADSVWEVCYGTRSGTECRVVMGSGSNSWKQVDFILSDVLFQKVLDRDSDLIIRDKSGDDTIFHMIEIDRL